MKRFKIGLSALAIVLLLGASAFKINSAKGLNNFYPVTATGTDTGTQLDASTLSNLRTHCPNDNSTVCVVQQTGTAPVTYKTFIVGGNYQ